MAHHLSAAACTCLLLKESDKLKICLYRVRVGLGISSIHKSIDVQAVGILDTVGLNPGGLINITE